MKLILPYFILILFLLQHNMKKNSKKEKINNETFWKREAEANSVRKKDISGLDYIRIPDTLTCPDTQDERILKEWHTIEALKEKKDFKSVRFYQHRFKIGIRCRQLNRADRL